MDFATVLDKYLALDIKKLMVIPVLMLIAGVAIVGVSYSSGTMPMSIEFKGGTLLTAPFEGENPMVEEEIGSALGYNVDTRVVRDALGNTELEIFIDTPLSGDEVDRVKKILQGKGIEPGSVASNIIQPSLGTEFFRQAIYALLFAFFLMALTVFLRFRSIVPSFAVVLSAFSDIMVTLGVMVVAGIQLSEGSLVALLLLIGYSVDTDILLTTRILKRKKEPILSRTKKSMLTGMTMSITTFTAMLVLFLVSSSRILDEVAIVVMIGMVVDMVNTWIQNTGILLWYMEAKR